MSLLNGKKEWVRKLTVTRKCLGSNPASLPSMLEKFGMGSHDCHQEVGRCSRRSGPEESVICVTRQIRGESTLRAFDSKGRFQQKSQTEVFSFFSETHMMSNIAIIFPCIYSFLLYLYHLKWLLAMQKLLMPLKTANSYPEANMYLTCIYHSCY